MAIFKYEDVIKKSGGTGEVKSLGFHGVQEDKEVPEEDFVSKAAKWTGGSISDAFQSGVSQVKTGLGQAGTATTESKNPLEFLGRSLEAGGNIGAGLVGAAFSPLAPVTKPVGAVIEKAGEGYGSLPAVQKFAQSKAGQTTSRVLETVNNWNTIAGTIAGGTKTSKVAGGVADTTSTALNTVKNKACNLTKPLKGVVEDVLPTRERFVNTEVTKALDLTAGDVKNISLSTGNEVGQFIAKNNLIGGNIAETTAAIKNFFKQNYDTVRNEIGKVKKIYDKNEIPAYKEALGQIKKQTDGIVGLEDVSGEVNSLLSKEKMTMNDIQRAKELLDEHFSLYKATGDVKEGASKAGLVNLRRELQSFIEEGVIKETGADIKSLNNNVSTSRSIMDAVETRSTRGLTRATISAGDIVTGLSGSALAGPLGGAVAVLAKKIYQSPSFKLKFTKWLDGLSDAKKIKIQSELEKGVLPKEIHLNQSSNTLSSVSKAENTQPTRATISKKSDLNIKKSLSQTTQKVNIPKSNTTAKPISTSKRILNSVAEKYKNTPNKKGGFAKISAFRDTVTSNINRELM